MKRFSKIFSGIAAIMLGVGIILVAFGIGSVRSDWDEVKAAWQGTDHVQREFDGVKHIEIDIPFGYLVVSATTGDQVCFEATDVKAEKLEIRQKDGKLEIRMDNGKNAMQSLLAFPVMADSRWGDNEKLSMQEYRLLLPENYAGELEIDLGMGKVWLDGVDAGAMNLSMDAGELVVEECRAGKLDADCDIGSCSVEGIFQDISVKMDIGVLDVNLYGSHEDYDGVIACEIGEMEYHMGLDVQKLVEYYNSAGESADGMERNDYSNDIIRSELGLEDYEDYADAVSWAEAWNRKGGIDNRKKWNSPNAKGKLEIKCDIGDVTVRFAGADFFETLQTQWKEATVMIDSGASAIPEEDSIPEDTATFWDEGTDGSWQNGETAVEQKRSGD